MPLIKYKVLKGRFAPICELFDCEISVHFNWKGYRIIQIVFTETLNNFERQYSTESKSQHKISSGTCYIKIAAKLNQKT